MKHHAFMLWSLLIFHSMFWPVQTIALVYNRHHGKFLSTILVVKPRNHLQIPIKSKPGRLVHHPARRQNP